MPPETTPPAVTSPAKPTHVTITSEEHYLFGKVVKVISWLETEIKIGWDDAGTWVTDVIHPSKVAPVSYTAAATTPPPVAPAVSPTATAPTPAASATPSTPTTAPVSAPAPTTPPASA